MPKRNDIETIMLIGSGPIIIGQACEFDYSGTQACKALKEEGYRVVLVNSNPATIMTDPEFADRTYIEPIAPEVVAEIIRAERPDALLPTLGGQTALNTAMSLAEMGVLEECGVELIGASIEAIDKAENRELFKAAMDKLGIAMPRSGIAHTMAEAWKVLEDVGFPAIIRPSFTLGGTGGGVAYNREEYEEVVGSGIEASPTNEVLIEQSIIGWKEYELEVMRDRNDNVVIICSIENFDPMGVHTGDSITVAPAQTLTDKEYQIMRDASLAIIREIGVDTGGSNIQFSVNPKDGELIVIEMNPRVSRSSALASKATGFPIAKIAAKLAVGYTLDELANDITRETKACFEPTIDYVVTKIPRFTFEKFPQTEDKLGTQMKSVGEVMAIGRTFKESLGKALRSLEIGSTGLDPLFAAGTDNNEEVRRLAATPNSRRIWYVARLLREGASIDDLYELTGIDPWFLDQMRQVTEADPTMQEGEGYSGTDSHTWHGIKALGFSDKYLAGNSYANTFIGDESDRLLKIQTTRFGQGVHPAFKRVDTCGAEFEAFTPYLYSTYESGSEYVGDDGQLRRDSGCEADATDSNKVMILGGGPNRIGQGIEFDYCCVHGAFSLSEDGFETIMVNCNPETVSTDYDTSDRLYFEPLTLEDVLEIIRVERAPLTGDHKLRLIVQFGGQTPLNLALPLKKTLAALGWDDNVEIIGTPPEQIDAAEDREQFAALLKKLNLKQPANATARTMDDAKARAGELGLPLVVRPSFVLGGRAMFIVREESELERCLTEAFSLHEDAPVLLDSFLDDAIEVDVDCVRDSAGVAIVAGIMEHIEEAGVHSGDSACCLPPFSLGDEVIAEIETATVNLANELDVLGLMNVQYAVKAGELFVIEVNPRASRTVPFVSKAVGMPFAKISARAMAGMTFAEQGVSKPARPAHFSVKEAVFPFRKFAGVDTVLGPEMKSTGEVMGIGPTFGDAFDKAQRGAGVVLPSGGAVVFSLADRDKKAALPIAARFVELGFTVLATGGTCAFFAENGVEAERVFKVREGSRPHIVDKIKDREIGLVINTTLGVQSLKDSFSIRRSALDGNVPYQTTIAGARASVEAIAYRADHGLAVKALQDYHK